MEPESLAPGTSTCVNLTVVFAAEGSYTFGSSLAYGIGVRNFVSSASTFTVRFGHINLLRYATAPGSGATSLDPERDLEVAAFSNDMSFPHASSDLTVGASSRFSTNSVVTPGRHCTSLTSTASCRRPSKL